MPETLIPERFARVSDVLVLQLGCSVNLDHIRRAISGVGENMREWIKPWKGAMHG